MGEGRSSRVFRRWAVMAVLLLATLAPAAGRAHFSPNHVIVASGYYTVNGLPYTAFNFIATKSANGFRGFLIAGAAVLNVTCLKIVNTSPVGHAVYARAAGSGGASLYVELYDFILDTIYVTSYRRYGPCGTGDFDRDIITGAAVGII